MSLDALRREDHGDSLVVVARDGEGRARSFLHFAPSFGRAAASLSLMRRDPGTPNGLMEWMIARTTLMLASRGCGRFSLNFTVRRRLFEEEARLSFVQRLEAAVLGMLNPFFQIERLRRFNEKFSPTWRPRYIYYEAPISLPRVLLAYLEAEELLRIPLVGARARLKTRLRRRSLRKALA